MSKNKNKIVMVEESEVETGNGRAFRLAAVLLKIGPKTSDKLNQIG